MGLRVLHGKDMVEGMSIFSLVRDFCEHFLYWKQNWVRFSSDCSVPKAEPRCKPCFEMNCNYVL
jgi:hypothetical protein